MASVFIDRLSEFSSADEPIEHEDQVDGSVYACEIKTEVQYKPLCGSVHDQLKVTREVFEDLKNSVITSMKVFEHNLAQLNSKEECLNNLSSRISSINFESAINLNVGGIFHQTSLETLRKCPGSLLAEMFSERFSLKQSKDGSYFIDRDGTHFRHILNYLRSGTAPVLSGFNTDTKEILHEAEDYGLDGLVEALNNKLNGDDSNSSENVNGNCKRTLNDIVDEARKEICETGQKLDSFLNLLEDNIKLLDEAASHHKKISMKLSNVHFCENVKIDVGGRKFKTSLKTLRREPDSVLALMFSEKFNLRKEDDGCFFIDRDGTLFHHILNYLRDGKIPEDVIEDYGSQIQREAEFYELSGLNEQIHNYRHVKLNVGGRDFLVMREILKKYPESMFTRMLSGEENTFKRRQDGTFHIERDGTSFHHILEYLRFGRISEEIVERSASSILDDANFYMLSGLRRQIIHNYDYILLNIRGKEFVISRKVLTRFPTSFFGKMLAGEEGDYVKRNDGSFYIQHDATNFCHILTFLRSGALYYDVSEKNTALLLDDAEFYMLPKLRAYINKYFNVLMRVGLEAFYVHRELLGKVPNSMFAKMLKGERGNYMKRKDGSYVIHRNGKNFNHILTYLRSGTLSDDIIRIHGALLLADADFYMLPGLGEQINSYLNTDVKLIIGGKEFVVIRKALTKVPNSLFGRMLTGEKGDYVKRNDGSYVIQRDATNFTHILNYLISGTFPLDVIKEHRALLIDDAEFYMLPHLKAKVQLDLLLCP